MPDVPFWNWKKGFLVSGCLLGALALLTFFGELLPFDGMCGSGLLFGARYPCSFAQRAVESLRWLELMGLLFWPVVLAILVVPPLLGAWLGRRRRA